MSSREYRSRWDFLIGRKITPSTEGSNTRRLVSRVSLFYVLFLCFEVWALALEVSAFLWAFAALSSLLAVSLFSFNVLLQPFIHGWRIHAARLFGDTLISAILLMLTFALWFRLLGIEATGRDVCTAQACLAYVPGALDALYFSIVTFSTLGFGDFVPKPSAQGFAAIAALLGNLHLGFIVGATFAATQKISAATTVKTPKAADTPTIQGETEDSRK